MALHCLLSLLCCSFVTTERATINTAGEVGTPEVSVHHFLEYDSGLNYKNIVYTNI